VRGKGKRGSKSGKREKKGPGKKKLKKTVGKAGQNGEKAGSEEVPS